MSKSFLFLAILTTFFLHAEKIKVDGNRLLVQSDRIFLNTDRGLVPLTNIVAEPSGLYTFEADIDFGLFWLCECGCWNGSSDEHCFSCDKRR
jgi:hypothetical protein